MVCVSRSLGLATHTPRQTVGAYSPVFEPTCSSLRGRIMMGLLAKTGPPDVWEVVSVTLIVYRASLASPPHVDDDFC